jgi:hypothetical protein
VARDGKIECVSPTDVNKVIITNHARGALDGLAFGLLISGVGSIYDQSKNFDEEDLSLALATGAVFGSLFGLLIGADMTYYFEHQ